MSEPVDLAIQLRPVFDLLVATRAVPASIWPSQAPRPEQLGLVEQGDRIRLPEDIQLLDADVIRANLTRLTSAWIRNLRIYRVVGSTNAALMGLAADGSVEGEVHLAELQVSGRGRRGRSWYSPFGSNLALTLGFAANRPASRLGGLSLVVGLAVVDALEQHGIAGLSLKWPNDILLNGAKLGGVLIEIASAGGRSELIVGIGLNIRLSPAFRDVLDQAVADLMDARATVDRNGIAACVISSVCEFVAEFQRLGFPPFRQAFEHRHHYHQQECQILQGREVIQGRVDGVDEDGALLLRTASGVTACHGGEVSLRPAG